MIRGAHTNLVPPRLRYVGTPAAVDVRIEGWERLVRLYGWEDGSSLRRPDLTPRAGPHAAGCDCCACLGRVGVGLAGVRP